MNTEVKKIIKIGGLSIFFILIIFYGFFVARNVIEGVKIRNVDITDGSTVNNNILNITGNAQNAVVLTLDGREISIDQKGNFSETIALLPGYNIINLRAQDKFGNVDEKNFRLYGGFAEEAK